MNQSRREMDFIQELEKNSVSITQINPKTANNNASKQNNNLNNFSNIPNVNISTIPITPTSPANQSNLSKYSQLLMVSKQNGTNCLY